MNCDSGGHAILEWESKILLSKDVPLRWHPTMKMGGAVSRRSARSTLGTGSGDASGSVRCLSRPDARAKMLLLCRQRASTGVLL
jgi:hypothetical protein